MQLLLGDVVRTTAARFGRRPAARFMNSTLTFAEVVERAEHLTFVLANRGIRRGSRIVWWGDTSLEPIPLFVALADLGAIFVPINPGFTKSEADAVVDRVDPALVLVDSTHDGGLPLAELVAGKRPSVVDVDGVNEEDPHIILFTSGTTGLPKGVVLSHRTDYIRAMHRMGSVWSVGPSICTSPQFHMGGWTQPLSCWMVGDEIVYVERGDPEELLGAVERHRPTRLSCIPAVWRRMLDAGPERFDTSSLVEANTATSPASAELLRGIREAFPHTTTSIVYGSTEVNAVSQLWPQDVLRKPDSVGPPLPGVYVKLDDDGQVLVRSPQVMSGYFRDPEATQQAMAGGWYHMGDVAEIDEEGCLRIVGRVKDLIRSGGETIAPSELDMLIQTHPAVADAAVAGVPDDDWGEIVTAFIVLRPRASIDLKGLRAYCEGKIASFKYPRRLEIVEEIPRTASTNQIQRRALVIQATENTLATA